MMPAKNAHELQLLRDKLVPPPATPGLVRQRLFKLLAQGLADYKVTLVNGRAATGKTTLVADFARHVLRPVAWLKVESAESEQHAFWHYLTASIAYRLPGFNPHQLLPESISSSQSRFSAETFAYALVEQCHNPLLLVVEDLHLTYDAEWVAPFFHRLLPLLPETVHVLITTRGLPPTQFARMRSKQTLFLMEEETLDFTLEEATQLFALHGKGADEALAAWRKTHGRAGILAAKALSANAGLNLRAQSAAPVNSLPPAPWWHPDWAV